MKSWWIDYSSWSLLEWVLKKYFFFYLILIFCLPHITALPFNVRYWSANKSQLFSCIVKTILGIPQVFWECNIFGKGTFFLKHPPPPFVSFSRNKGNRISRRRNLPLQGASSLNFEQNFCKDIGLGEIVSLQIIGSTDI